MAASVVEFGKTPTEVDGRLDAAAFHRNHAPIWSVLAPLLGAAGDVLELGSGTGQHAAAFARASPHITWWPSDPDPRHRASIAAWRAHAGLANLRAPMPIDLAEAHWPLAEHGAPDRYLALFCANVVHIAPWRAAEGLFAGAGRHLAADGRLVLYGPFMRGGRHTAPSNADFDAGLRRANAEWGVRDIDALCRLADAAGLRLAEIADMPANNLVLVFARTRP
jgi:SAM-dependent methyltransferase